MNRRPARAETRSLGKKIAVCVGVLIAGGAVLAGVFGSKGPTAHDTSAAAVTPVASHSEGIAAESSAKAKHTQPTTPGPAQKLASLDTDGRPADQYQQVLDALAPRCREDRPRLAAIVSATLKGLRRNGVDDEDGFSVLQHLEQLVPAGAPRVSCASSAAAYAKLRVED